MTGLRLAPPSEPPADNRVSIARALLDRWFPVASHLVDQAVSHTDPGGSTTENYQAIESDPRYLIGRLQQALTALLNADVPRPGATGMLLGQAIEDACCYRERTCPKCPPESVCARCWPGWLKASAYRALWLELGIVGGNEQPPPRPELRVAQPGGDQ